MSYNVCVRIEKATMTLKTRNFYDVNLTRSDLGKIFTAKN